LHYFDVDATLPWFVAIKDIQEGDELLWAYKVDPATMGRSKTRPLPCSDAHKPLQWVKEHGDTASLRRAPHDLWEEE
jgi:hypothetical protein